MSKKILTIPLLVSISFLSSCSFLKPKLRAFSCGDYYQLQKSNQELLQQEDNRLTIFPIKYPKIWDMYNKAVSTFWVPEEIDFSRDMDDWNALGENEQYFIKHIRILLSTGLFLLMYQFYMFFICFDIF